MSVPVVFQYQRALDEFRREGREPPLLKRMSELISLLDLTTTLNSNLSGAEILDAALLIVMGELQVARGALLVRRDEERFELVAGRGLAAGSPRSFRLGPLSAGEGVLARSQGREAEAFDSFGFELLCPVFKGDRAIAVLGMGPRAGGRPYGPEETGFLRSVAACAATPIENGLIYDQLRKVNDRLSVKVFQLRNLFEISRELTGSFDVEAIQNLVTATLMGQLMVSRCALFLGGPKGLRLAHERGVRGEDGEVIPEAVARPVLDALRGPTPVSSLPAGPLRDRLTKARLALAVPLSVGDRVEGFAAVGERVSGAPFTEEDGDFAQTLARQALAALETVRLHRVQVEKLRQDRELQIAREIQGSLFPRAFPALPGFELAAESHACYEVGGDYYDFIPIAGGRLAVTVADVSGKGTPASILMASVHASLHALAGTADPALVLTRLNRFLFENTQANKYVTLFYGELDAGTGWLRYVNAGHVPPYYLEAAGEPERLEVGGPALGLLEEAAYAVGEVRLTPGHLLAVVTDGATEALSPEGEEFGDGRISTLLREASQGAASEVLRCLVQAVDSWTGPAGCSDDLTALVMKAL